MPDYDPRMSVADAETLSVVLSLEATLPCNETTLSAMRRRLAARRFRDAFSASFVERIHQALDACDARAYEDDKGHFHYHHHNLYQPQDYPPDLAWCDRIFASPTAKALAARLSGRQCTGPTSFFRELVSTGRPFAAAYGRGAAWLAKSPLSGVSPKLAARVGRNALLVPEEPPWCCSMLTEVSPCTGQALNRPRLVDGTGPAPTGRLS